MLCSAVSIIGGITITYFVITFALWVYRTYFHDSGFKKRYVSKDKWAVVTACTDGIGKGFVEELARQGMNVVLVSRTQSKLEAIATSLQTQFKVNTKTVAVDFTASDDQIYPKIQKAVENLNVSVLVNNVGVNTDEPNTYADMTDKEIEDQINVNVRGTLKVTRLFLSKMIANKHGLIINLSSVTGIYPPPMMAVYGATKAFINSFSQSLSQEVKQHGVEVVALTPYYVVSAMSGFRKPSLSVPTPNHFARDSLKQLGFFNNFGTLNPYFMHSITAYLFSLLPRGLLLHFTKQQLSVVRKKLLARKERNAKSQ